MDFDDDDDDARTRAVRRVHDRRARTPVTRVARACADRVLVAARSQRTYILGIGKTFEIAEPR